MEKKESRKPQISTGKDAGLAKPAGIIDIKPKLAKYSQHIFGITKFILGVCLLPFVYSTSRAFLNELNNIETNLQSYFWLGTISLLLVYLFVWEPAIIYTKGQKILEKVFSFFAPLVKVAPYLLPIYMIIAFSLYWIAALIFKSDNVIRIFMFLFGSSIALHLIFSAKSLRSKQQDFLKANYIFGFSFIYILNFMLLTFCLNLIFGKFSFVNFANHSFQTAGNIFYMIFKQLFLP